MEQKTIWMCYLHIGISALLILGVGCDSNTEKRVDADLVFSNKTDYQINYSGLFNLSAGDTQTKHVVGVGGSGSNSNNCCQGALESFQGSYNQVYLILDDSLCLFYNESEGPTVISNFEAILIEENHYRFTYIFIQESLSNISDCN
jgi:hypothetical protein